MSNVIEFMQKKWCAGPVKCFHCMHEWVGVWPENISLLYCPKCDKAYGIPQESVKKPMSDDCANAGYEHFKEYTIEDLGPWICFEAGIRYAEKHHDITSKEPQNL